MEFSEADEAGIGERHRLVAVAVHELAERGEIAFKGEGDLEHSPFDQRKQWICVEAVSTQNVRGFGDHWFAGKQGRPKRRDGRAGPAVVLRLPGEEGNERSGIGDNDLAHWPKSSRYFGFVAMSQDPSRHALHRSNTEDNRERDRADSGASIKPMAPLKKTAARPLP